MTYRGRIEHGVVVLDAPQTLPEGTEVEVSPVTPPKKVGEAVEKLAEAAQDLPATWGEAFKDVIGKAEGLPEDFAMNHDHYIHGTSKR